MPDGYRPTMGCELELVIANYEASKLTGQFERPPTACALNAS
jgi:hypothetical protein